MNESENWAECNPTPLDCTVSVLKKNAPVVRTARAPSVGAVSTIPTGLVH
jgi:hypothetical protein